MSTVSTVTSETLERLGFKEAAGKLREQTDRKRKLAIAYENYRYVREEKIAEFNVRLKKETITGRGPYESKSLLASWSTLAFTAIEAYEEVPPTHVLEKLGEAQERKCFDSFEIASIRQVKDPILFGRIANCPDRFFIDQWDEDVRIEDILKANEG